MVCVQQMMGNIAEGLFQVIAVQLPHVRVLMGEPQGAALSMLHRDAAAFFRQLHAVMDRLTAAAGTAAGTSHDFHKVVADLASLQGGHELAGVQQAAGHSHGNHSRAGDLEFSFLPAVHAPDVAKASGSGFFPVTR